LTQIDLGDSMRADAEASRNTLGSHQLDRVPLSIAEAESMAMKAFAFGDRQRSRRIQAAAQQNNRIPVTHRNHS
jgi:hypothetical protein